MKVYLQQHIRQIRLFTGLLSVLLVLVAILAIATKGLNWGLDFTGGMMTEIHITQPTTLSPTSIDKHDIETALQPTLGQFTSVTPLGGEGRWLIRYATQPAGIPDIAAILADHLSHSDSQIDVVSNSMVGSQVGQGLMEQSAIALMVTLLCILLYLSVRFEWRLASGALLALAHDTLLVVGLFAITQMEFNLTVFAAILAILGYSLNDSIVIADRVREGLITQPEKATAEICDNAIISTFARTMVTSGTTLLTVVALWIMGGAALQGFAIAMFVGIVSGTWSSISLGTLIPQWLSLEPKHYQPPLIDDMP
uniref:protein translocase subunit SecF n=1 Tax=Thaumasiovibrio occultus TaxID=1891184 RepID=UPI000B35CABC|nr:protein translocase subunit SecF [Thaumasiovibrio occultus]